jgi:hypothetical protein
MVSQQPRASFPLPLQWLRFGTPAGTGASIERGAQSSPRDIAARLADLTAGIAEAERRLASLEMVDEAQHNQQARTQQRGAAQNQHAVARLLRRPQQEAAKAVQRSRRSDRSGRSV